MKKICLVAAIALFTSIQLKAQKEQIYTSNSYAIAGYDPVAYFKNEKAVKGKKEYSYQWKDANWLFSTKEDMDLFAANPEKYAPQYGGYCTYGLSEGHKAPPDPNTWTIVDGKLYFNYSKDVKTMWIKNPKERIQEADKQWSSIKDKEQSPKNGKNFTNAGYDVSHFETGSANKNYNQMIAGLFETHLYVRSLEKSVEFYRNTLNLELCYYKQERRAAFFWIGKPKEAMLGLWEKPEGEIESRHFAFRCDVDDVLYNVVPFLKQRNLKPRNFLRDGSEKPMVFAWMPAIAIYFDDPDGHELEFIAMLEGEGKPRLGIVSYDQWLEQTS